jgi:hypothetical protein
MTLIMYILRSISGADPEFQVRGSDLKQLRRAKGGANILGVFRVKNHDFTPKNLIFFNFRGGGGRAPGTPPGHQFRNLLTLIVEKCWY